MKMTGHELRLQSAAGGNSTTATPSSELLVGGHPPMAPGGVERTFVSKTAQSVLRRYWLPRFGRYTAWKPCSDAACSSHGALQKVARQTAGRFDRPRGGKRLLNTS